jgi:antitoxin CptB
MSEINKLRWHCRRGSLELDLILSRYLDTVYALATPTEQQAFQRLLDLEDTDLLRYLLGEDTPPDIDLVNLVQVLRLMPKS